MTPKIKNFVRQVVEEMWNEKRPELIEQLFTADCTLHTPDVVLEGHAGLKQLYATYTTAFPDFRIRTEDIIADGNKIAVRFTFAGTHQGPLGQIAATGKTANIEAIVLFRLSRGKADEVRFVWDRAELLQQISVVQHVSQEYGRAE